MSKPWYEMSLYEKRKDLEKKVTSNKGEFTVLGVDMFDGTDYVIGKYKTKKQAFEIAEKNVKEALRYASDASIADYYYVYDSVGNYLGQGSCLQ